MYKSRVSFLRTVYPDSRTAFPFDTYSGKQKSMKFVMDRR